MHVRRRVVILLLAIALAAAWLCWPAQSPPHWGEISDAIRDLSARQPVFPGAEGFGSDTPAGRGGKLWRVSSLADDGPGSLRAALSAQGPRTIVFEVGGTIQIEKDLEILEPFVTVAGQSAPEPGITLAGAGLCVRSHDVLIQHLRVRVGDAPSGEPKDRRRGIHFIGAADGSRQVYNVVVDHCSISWATDEGVTSWFPGVRDVTISNCIIAETLAHAGHPKGEHSKGMLIGDYSKRMAVLRNLFAHNRDRNPRVKADASALIVNNLVYDYGVFPVGLGGADVASRAPWATLVGNHFRAGPSTTLKPAIWVDPNTALGTTLFLADNIASTAAGEIEPPLEGHPQTLRLAQPSVWLHPLSVQPAAAVFEHVLAHAGARPRQRDKVDQRIVSQVRSGTGRVIDSQNEVGGSELAASSKRTLEETAARAGIPLSAHLNRLDDCHTELERILQALAASMD